MVSRESPAPSPGGNDVVYDAPDGEVRVDVRFDRETVWVTQQQVAELFGRDRSVVTRHIRNAFREGGLDPEAASVKFAQVRSEGGRTVSRESDHYNLDVIISVGQVFSRGGVLFGELRPCFHKVGVAPTNGVCSTDIAVIRPSQPASFGFLAGHVPSVEFVDYTDAGCMCTRMQRARWLATSSFAGHGR